MAKEGGPEALLFPAADGGFANPAFTLSRYVGVRGDLSTTVTAATEDW